MSHEHWHELAAGYALDALDAADHAEFETHLSSCFECRRTVQEFRDVSELLPHAAQTRALPPKLEAQIIDRIRLDARTHRRFRGAIPWLAAAAGIAIAITGGLLARRASLERDRLQDHIASLAADLAARDSSVASLLGPEVHMVALASPGGEPVARVFWNHSQNRFVVTTFGLPPAPDGRTYQLWAIPERGQPTSMGTIDVRDDGRDITILPVSAEIEALGLILSCAITVEPAGGSPAPTEAPRLIGNWIHTE